MLRKCDLEKYDNAEVGEFEKMTKYEVLQKIRMQNVRKMVKCWRVKGYNLRIAEAWREKWGLRKCEGKGSM